MSHPIEWKAISLTTVIYPKGDIYGKFLAFFSLLPVAIVIAFFTLTVFVRDIHVILFFIGQLSNEILNDILKNQIREDRPINVFRDQLMNPSFGWPSSHSQFIAFFTVYSTLAIVFRLRKLKSRWFCFALILLQSISIVFVLHSRTYLLYHYPHQCFHGICIGASFALLWYLLVQFIFEPLVYKYVIYSQLNQSLLGLCSIYLPLEKNKNQNQLEKDFTFSKNKNK